jgi:hypothetical protein
VLQARFIKLAAVEAVAVIIFLDGLGRQALSDSDFGIAEMIYAGMTAIIAALVLTRRKSSD